MLQIISAMLHNLIKKAKADNIISAFAFYRYKYRKFLFIIGTIYFLIA